MKTGDTEIIKFISFEEQDEYRRRGYDIAPHPHGKHRIYGLIASKRQRKKPKKNKMGKSGA